MNRTQKLVLYSVYCLFLLLSCSSQYVEGSEVSLYQTSLTGTQEYEAIGAFIVLDYSTDIHKISLLGDMIYLENKGESVVENYFIKFRDQHYFDVDSSPYWLWEVSWYKNNEVDIKADIEYDIGLGYLYSSDNFLVEVEGGLTGLYEEHSPIEYYGVEYRNSFVEIAGRVAVDFEIDAKYVKIVGVGEYIQPFDSIENDLQPLTFEEKEDYRFRGDIHLDLKKVYGIAFRTGVKVVYRHIPSAGSENTETYWYSGLVYDF